MADDIINLVLQVQGQDKAAALRGQVDQLRDRITALGTSVSATDPRMLALANQMKVARDQAELLDKQFGRMAGAGGGGAKAAFVMTQVANAADDASYGWRGVQNNMVSALSMFGVWGSVIAVGSIGIAKLAENWRGLTSNFRTDLFDHQASAVDTLTKRMEELQKTTHLTAAEMRELGNLKVEVAGLKFEASQVGKGYGPGVVKEAFNNATGADVAKEGGRGGTGYGELSSVAQDAMQHAYGKDPIAYIRRAVQEGRLKTEDGTVITPEALEKGGFGKGGGFDRKMMGRYQNQAMPANVREMLRRIGEDGDPAAVEQLKGMMKDSGRYSFDKDGKVRDSHGKELQSFTALMKGTPEEVRKAAKKAKADAEDEAFLSDRDAKAKEDGAKVLNRLSGKILDGAKHPEIKSYRDQHLVELRQQAREMLRQLNPGAVIDEAMIDQAVTEAREKLESDVADLMAKEGVSREEAVRRVRKAHRTEAQVRRDDMAERFHAQRRQEVERKRADQENGAAGREASREDRLGRAFEGQLAGATGFADPITQMLFEARQRGLEKDFDKSTRTKRGYRAYFNRSFGEQEDALGRINDEAREATIRQTAAAIYRQNGNRDPMQARAAAERLVNERAKSLGDQLGDPQTKALEESTKATDGLTKAIADLKNTGVRVRMNP